MNELRAQLYRQSGQRIVHSMNASTYAVARFQADRLNACAPQLSQRCQAGRASANDNYFGIHRA
jgi:hypothetical protein